MDRSLANLRFYLKVQSTFANDVPSALASCVVETRGLGGVRRVRIRIFSFPLFFLRKAVGVRLSITLSSSCSHLLLAGTHDVWVDVGHRPSHLFHLLPPVRSRGSGQFTSQEFFLVRCVAYRLDQAPVLASCGPFVLAPCASLADPSPSNVG